MRDVLEAGPVPSPAVGGIQALPVGAEVAHGIALVDEAQGVVRSFLEEVEIDREPLQMLEVQMLKVQMLKAVVAT